MSVLIKDMEKPKSCYAVIDGEDEYCPFVNTDEDCVLLLKKGICEGTWEEQYSKCPIVETSEPCEDAVSRADILSMIDDMADDVMDGFGFAYDQWKEQAEELPPVTPKQRTGQWIKKHRHYGGFRSYTGFDAMGEQHTVTVDERTEYDDLYCSECGARSADNFLNFCPNCGAKMEGVSYETD